MSCIWNLFKQKAKPTKEPNLPLRIRNPLNLDEMPVSKLELEAMEAAIIDILVSLHYQNDETKMKMKKAFQDGDSVKGKQFLAKKTHLLEKKRIMEHRLEKVRAGLQELKAIQ